MNENLIFEHEMDAPKNWETNIIFIRDTNGKVIEVKADDDIEEGEQYVKHY